MRRECGDEAYVRHIEAEHRRLDRLIRRVLQAIGSCQECAAGSWPQPVVAGLAAVRQELAQHFAEEESGGCLEEAVARCPAMSSDTDRVQAEHGGLLGVLDELTLHCQQIQRPTRRDLLAVEHELRAVAHKLRMHEAQENRIMQRAFAICLENGDIPSQGEQSAVDESC
jgi:hemerythrin HHE cation binding domain-containing protein